jgi:hypothetical protein
MSIKSADSTTFSIILERVLPGNTYEGERSAQLISLYYLVYISSFQYLKNAYLFYETNQLNEEVNCTEPSPKLVSPAATY